VPALSSSMLALEDAPVAVYCGHAEPFGSGALLDSGCLHRRATSANANASAEAKDPRHAERG
jgi:hypothetical protein